MKKKKKTSLPYRYRAVGRPADRALHPLRPARVHQHHAALRRRADQLRHVPLLCGGGGAGAASYSRGRRRAAATAAVVAAAAGAAGPGAGDVAAAGAADVLGTLFPQLVVIGGRERKRDFIGEGVSTRKRFRFLLSKKGKKKGKKISKEEEEKPKS